MMMKKTFLLSVVATIALIGSTFATDSVSRDPTLHQAQSCTEVETALKSYIESHWYAGNFGPLAKGGVMLNDTSTKAAVQAADGMGGGGGGENFSATNTQKSGVDEPELIKTNGSYIYYLYQQTGILHILDPKNQKELSSLPLPKDYWNAQLLLNGSKLILIGSKSIPYSQTLYDKSFIYRDQQVLIAVYDITQATPKFAQAYTFDGWLQDSRIVDGQLVLVASQSLNRGPVYRAVNDMMNTPTKPSLNVQDFALHAVDILPKWSTLSYGTRTDKSGQVKLLTRKKTLPIDCTQFMYKKPDPQQKGVGYYGSESLTSIIRIGLDGTNLQPQIKTIVGNSAQIHVSQKSIYLTSSAYMPSPFMCPAYALCMPWRGEGSYTIINGFDLDTLTYKYSSVVEGNTWNQYSMDENNAGLFRIVTSNWRNGKNTNNVFIINPDGKIAGKLQDIAPGETFYGVRFIDDYLYLVTYKQVDPLFVIDTSNPTKPSIVGQLKMPGYSTYLHPYGALKNGVQYLIGLGYDTKTLDNGAEQVGGVKVDLYKVDFTKKDTKGFVTVSQQLTKTFGQVGSQTEALNNPRMFVFNPSTNELILPLVLAETKKAQSCNIIYDTDGKELKKDCYPYDQAITTFAGIKSWELTPDAMTEKISIDYKNMIKNPYPQNIGEDVSNLQVSSGSFIDPRWFSTLQPRVGYIGGQYYFIGNQFAHFFTKGDQKGVFVNFK